VPLLLGKELLGVLLLFHPEPGRYAQDQFDLIQAAGNQIAVAINNAGLFQLIQDQARDLGNLLRKQQIETSRSRAILEAISEGVLVTDSQSRITLFNDSAQRILDLSRDQIIDQPLENFSGLFGGAGRAWIETIRAWSSNHTMNSVHESYSEQIVLDNGSVVSVNLAPVIYRDEFLGTVSIFHDITHQIEVDRLKSEFVATVSHELRTPMTSIKGYVEILLMGAAGSLTSQQTRFLEIVKNNSERLAILVNDLIDISRIESGRVELSLQPIDIQTVVTNIIEDLRIRSDQDNKAMTISTDIPANIPRVMADPERFRQIMDNLLSNAYAYTPEKGQIIIRARQVNSHIQVDVQDTGIGISPEDHDRVFERFYRGDHPFVLATSGTGLGLSITRQLVEMHRGSIWLESNGIPEEGSTFSFTIPVYIQNPILIEEEAMIWQEF
jgi:PAS domain S-box-containing protein